MNSAFLSKLSAFVIVLAVLAFGQFPHFTGRVGAGNDGNQFANDDYGAAGWEVAMFAKAGARLMVIDYNDNLGSGSQLSRELIMHNSAVGACNLWYHDTSMCYNDMDPTQRTAAIAAIAGQINLSAPGDTFYYICGGPMEMPWRGIMASDSGKRKYSLFISHSGWNNQYNNAADSMIHKFSDIQKTGVSWRQISNQNANMGSGCKLTVFHTSSDTAVRFLYSIMPGGDISDAGMAYYVVTGLGDTLGTPADLQAWFCPTVGTISNSQTGSFLSRHSPAAFDELKIFDMRGRLLECFAFNGKMSFDRMPHIRYASPYLALFGNEGSVVNVKLICNPAR